MILQFGKGRHLYEWECLFLLFMLEASLWLNRRFN